MLSDRLSFARDQGLLTLSGRGRICVFGAGAGDDLSDLGDVQVVQTMRPAFDALQRRGVNVVSEAEGDFDTALVALPRARALAQDLIARATAMTGGGDVWIDGQKTDGAESVIRSLRKRGITVDPVISKAHGKLFRIKGVTLDDWRAGRTVLADGMVTSPGAFSADGVDRGSALLAGALPVDMRGVVVDLGAGWGYLSARMKDRAGVTHLHLLEADLAALECARANVDDARAVFHWADALTFALEGGADHVVTNPPFHTGRTPDPSLGRAFIAAAAGLLKPGGHLWLVANRHLPYEGELDAHFATFTDLTDDPAFKVIHAERPRRKRV